MIIDDPIKNREEADSETHRGKIWDEWIDSPHVYIRVQLSY